MFLFKLIGQLFVGLAAVIAVSGQGENSICGHIKNGELTIPSYSFQITDPDGRPVAVGSSGNLRITENIWMKEGWFDGHWQEVKHDLEIPITCDPKTGICVSQEMPKITIAHRRKGLLLFSCWDRVHTLSFSFRAQNGDWGIFVFHFPNKPLKKVSLPDSKAIIKVPLTASSR